MKQLRAYNLPAESAMCFSIIRSFKTLTKQLCTWQFMQLVMKAKGLVLQWFMAVVHEGAAMPNHLVSVCGAIFVA